VTSDENQEYLKLQADLRTKLMDYANKAGGLEGITILASIELSTTLQNCLDSVVSEMQIVNKNLEKLAWELASK